MYPFEAFFACVAAVSSACIAQRNEPSQLGGSATRSTTVGWTSTVVLHKCEPDLIASSTPGPPYTNWSGLLTQGPACLLHPFVHSRIWAYHQTLCINVWNRHPQSTLRLEMKPPKAPSKFQYMGVSLEHSIIAS